MTILDSIKDYITTCPHLKLFQDAFIDINVDYSEGDKASTYSINVALCEPILKTYIGGSTERQFLFTFDSVEYFGSEVGQHIESIGFYELFAQWLEDNSRNRILPTMGTGKEALTIKALTGGYLFDNQADGSLARYSIQCQLTYIQE